MAEDTVLVPEPELPPSNKPNQIYIPPRIAQERDRQLGSRDPDWLTSEERRELGIPEPLRPPTFRDRINSDTRNWAQSIKGFISDLLKQATK